MRSPHAETLGARPPHPGRKWDLPRTPYSDTSCTGRRFCPWHRRVTRAPPRCGCINRTCSLGFPCAPFRGGGQGGEHPPHPVSESDPPAPDSECDDEDPEEYPAEQGDEGEGEPDRHREQHSGGPYEQPFGAKCHDV